MSSRSTCQGWASSLQYIFLFYDFMVEPKLLLTLRLKINVNSAFFLRLELHLSITMQVLTTLVAQSLVYKNLPQKLLRLMQKLVLRISSR